MLTLYYSADAVAAGIGTCWYRTTEGKEVEITIVIDHAIDPRSSFGWPDAVKVGEAPLVGYFVREGVQASSLWLSEHNFRFRFI